MQHLRHTFAWSLILGTVLIGRWPSAAAADEKPAGGAEIAVRVTGLFSPDRVDDLRELVATIPGLTLKRVDFETTDATFAFDPAVLFPNAKPADFTSRLDQLIRANSRSTFGVEPPLSIPRDRLRRVEIGVVGLDCKGCCLAAYESIARIEGVEQATASFKEGLVTAWIDPEKTSQEALEETLVKRRVELKKASAP